jgi:hypothetical protein
MVEEVLAPPAGPKVKLPLPAGITFAVSCTMCGLAESFIVSTNCAVSGPSEVGRICAVNWTLIPGGTEIGLTKQSPDTSTLVQTKKSVLPVKFTEMAFKGDVPVLVMVKPLLNGQIPFRHWREFTFPKSTVLGLS